MASYKKGDKLMVNPNTKLYKEKKTSSEKDPATYGATGNTSIETSVKQVVVAEWYKTITKTSSSSTNNTIKVNDKVTVKKGATFTNGVKPYDFVFSTTFTVYQIKGSSILIGLNGQYTGWMDSKYLVNKSSSSSSTTSTVKQKQTQIYYVVDITIGSKKYTNAYVREQDVHSVSKSSNKNGDKINPNTSSKTNPNASKTKIIKDTSIKDATGFTDKTGSGIPDSILKYNTYVNNPNSKSTLFTLSDEGRDLFNNDDNIKQSIFNMGIIDREDYDSKNKENNDLLHKKFDRNGCVDPYNGFIGAKEYVFFTRPDLHMFKDTTGKELNEELSGLPLFKDMLERYPYVFRILQSSLQDSDNPESVMSFPFINLLTNTISSSIQLPDISSKTLETGTNAYGTKISYRGTSHPSDEDINFSTEFTDNRYLEVFNLFKIYDEYEKQKHLGYITPRDISYSINKILDDQISIFKIVVGEDGESIIYWCKWTGCFPTNVPTDSLSNLVDTTGNLSLNISWHAQFFEDMDEEILYDFNAVVRNHISSTSDKDIQLYDPITGMSNGEWAHYPYIAKQENSVYTKEINSRITKMRRLKLKWR